MLCGTQLWCALTEKLRPSASKLSFWLTYLPGKSGGSRCWNWANIGVCWQTCFAFHFPSSSYDWDLIWSRSVEHQRPVRLEMLNLRKVIDVLAQLDRNAPPVSFQTFVLVEISSKQDRFTKSVTCQVWDVVFELSQWCPVETPYSCKLTERLRLSASKPFVLVQILPRQEHLKTASCQVRNVELVSTQRCSMELINDVHRLKSPSGQLPTSYSDRDIPLARAAKKQRPVCWIWVESMLFSWSGY